MGNTGREAERNYDALYRNGRCVLCDTPAHMESVALHAAGHLANGSAVVQGNKKSGEWVWRVVPTASVPTVDAEGVGLYENDHDTWDRKDANSHALREAYTKAKALSRETAKRVRAAQGGT